MQSTKERIAVGIETFSLSTLIVASCVSFTGQVQNACTNSLDAGSKQAGLEMYVNKAKDMGTQKVDYTAKYLIGEKQLGIIGSAMWIKKVADERKVTLSLPKFPLYDSASTDLSENSTKLNLQWKF